MMFVGQVSNKEEALEFEYVSKIFVVSNRARYLASLSRNGD